MLRLIALGLGGLLLLSGCASYGMVKNAPLSTSASASSYSVTSVIGHRKVGNIALALAFSGGGTRAAALAYGVLEELRDTTVMVDGHARSMLDEVDLISAVSGGSFTAAYYGLNGERTFKDFEQQFLRQNMEQKLIYGALNPLHWFSTEGRTEMAIQYYDKSVFRGATFADLQNRDAPLILINASELGLGTRFTFSQEYFDLLCSDIASFPIARAVAASSAVPVLFNPVVLENYKGCKPDEHGLLRTSAAVGHGPEMSETLRGLTGYLAHKDRYRYLHLVDGGITDNLGLRAIYEIIEASGGIRPFVKHLGQKPVRRFAIISVDASTDLAGEMAETKRQPSLEQTIKAVSAIQLHRYNASTLELMHKSVQRWAKELSSPGKDIKPYFIEVDFNALHNREQKAYFDRIPTSFSLTGEEVHRLIEAGGEILRQNQEFRRLVEDFQHTLN